MVRRDPVVTGFIGFLFGGIGLGLWLRSWFDLFAPVALAVMTFVVLDSYHYSYGWAVGAGVCAVYGFFRADSINRRLDRRGW